jgi:hypothetical protein
MPFATIKKLMATALVVAMLAMYAPALAAPAPATLTGTVYGDNVTAPLAGATVIVTDAQGTKLASLPTAANGGFTVGGVAPGTQNLAIETKDGLFAIATPITLAPGETKGVRLALKASGDSEEEKKKKGGGAGWTGGAKAAMIAVIVGFAAAGAIGINQAGDNSQPEASPYVPPEDK